MNLQSLLSDTPAEESASGWTEDQAYLQGFEAKMGAVARMDSAMAQAGGLQALAYEQHSLQRLLHRTDGLAAAYADRSVVQDMLGGAAGRRPAGYGDLRALEPAGHVAGALGLLERGKRVREPEEAEPRKQARGESRDPRLAARQYDVVFQQIWKDLARKDGPKVLRQMQQLFQAKMINYKKTAVLALREARRWQLKNNKNQKDLTSKARRAMREMFNFWKRLDRMERDQKKRHERERMDKAKKEEEERELRRQSRKLDFLITQTELYSHFVGKKRDKGEKVDLGAIDFDSADDDKLRAAAAQNAQRALETARERALAFDPSDTNGEMNFQNPTLIGDMSIAQPQLLRCTLKEYQTKGLNWLANLYEQGINGILADEMGLGKTVQSISVLAYLAETHNIWGPFLVVTPSLTLHNWQQEILKFVPDFKVLPYWGSAKDRKILRKYWKKDELRYGRDSHFHVLVTSYQLVVADAAFFQKMKWQYMILDEAQAIKSLLLLRWKLLLSFQCRNRLLLTGTPIQNLMQELWALLHFIMPLLFDSHDEFSDWFAKDIESHAQLNTQLNEQQLERLHVILKPFMLRRVKKNVQLELGDKVEIDLFCDLTTRQKKYYQMLKSSFSLRDILENSRGLSDDSTLLMNLVMQFRKVCNHPDLFERADVRSPFAFGSFAETSLFLRETELELAYTYRNDISYAVPKQVYRELLVPGPRSSVGLRGRIAEMFNIYSEDNYDAYAWAPFCVSPSALRKTARQNILERALADYVPRGRLVLKPPPLMTELTSVRRTVFHDMYINALEPAAAPPVSAPPVHVVCSDIGFGHQLEDTLFNREIRRSLAPMPLNEELRLLEAGVPVPRFPKSNLLPAPLNHLMDYSSIAMPLMHRFITESGKLLQLDRLLDELKRNDHRVLIYFQMTRMMDLMEEYLTYRQHKHIRLDGLLKLEDRRDLVNDWQTKPEIFVFLLSTRAGGLGINLTAADTVIFYDSDWNPTIDSQAMDRAHRLGQTKQVTVYRLLTKNTIEQRMRDRAKQKEQVQQVVMEGKAKVEAKDVKKKDAAAKKKDVAFLLLGDDNADFSDTGLMDAMYEEDLSQGTGDA